MAEWDVKTRTAAKTQKESSVDFGFSAPQARNVSVAGTFNNWNTNALKLTRDFRGNWSGSWNLKPGRYEYRFFVDGNWADDPKAKTTVQNEFGSKNAILDVK